MPGLRKKQLHDLELHLGQLDGLAGLEQQAAVLVQDELPAHQGGGGVFPLAAAPAHPAAERLDPGQQLADREGLGHIIVRADGQAPDLVLLLALGAEDDDADLLVGTADGLAEGEAVHPRQHHIQDGGAAVGGLLQRGQRLLGAAGLEHLHPVAAQVQRDDFADAGLILYHQYFYHRFPSLQDIQRAGQPVQLVHQLDAGPELGLHQPAGHHPRRVQPDVRSAMLVTRTVR